MTIFSINLFWLTIAPSYYWLMYALAFIIWFWIIKKRWKILNKSLDDLFMYIFLWVVLWWRLGYILFYNFGSYISEPLSILKVWEWWMSFHWWVLWVIVAMLLFAKKYKINFLKIADQVTAILPIWLWLWRIGNYLNWELLGYSWYNWFLAIYNNWIWYFPSTLLEAFLEWLVLYIILLYVYKRQKFEWQIATLFLIYYSLFRVFVEIFFRTPDLHIWYILWYFTMWEILSLPMLVVWLVLYFRFNKK